MRQFFGKYRGRVENNIDPLQLGRLQVSVPAVLGEGRNSWAMPCVPYAGVGVGFFVIPPNGANLWVEFEGGNPDYPIWAGCFWGTGEVPALPAAAEVKVLKTDVGSITLNDLPGVGGISIETNAGMKIAISATGIEISNSLSKIQLTGPQVSVNDGALEVT
ncbi:baseplate assembly protein [Nostoc piscinale CENA21]|uniref:Baseplate assembly protein n=1 Tax=Nostoc piscinale CENA21 TaxID=224013 RepID=A0A0M4T2Y1_9NOSO|nr:phage baseplate assembly protein V [Nostoc piscinale]ALF52891.1 baseplate assembly protein [Nostoc piscinale CENA21]